MILKTMSLATCLALALIAGGIQSQSAEEPVKKVWDIIHITGDLYRVRNGHHYSIYLVTPEGIILADPLGSEFATWLKTELDNRHGVPVRYVLYSHHHWDHAEGARIFDDTATLVGHENFPEARARSIEEWPAQFILNDKNNNGGLDRHEAFGLAIARFDGLDTNEDDFLTAAEILADVRLPEVLYSGNMSIHLGGKTVELIHPGANHTTDMTVLRFPEERVVFGVDFVNVKRLPLGYPGTGTLDEWIDAIRQVEALDFDTLVPGHSLVGSKEEFSAFRKYVEDLRTVVVDAIASGVSLDTLLASDALTEYSELSNYNPQRDRNIIASYKLLDSGEK